jgi:hypothetical protein
MRKFRLLSLPHGSRRLTNTGTHYKIWPKDHKDQFDVPVVYCYGVVEMAREGTQSGQRGTEKQSLSPRLHSDIQAKWKDAVESVTG